MPASFFEWRLRVKVQVPRCAGLDVHKDTVVACARFLERGRARYETKTFSTMTQGLFELSEWLESFRITAVVMEATGVYWKPVWHILDGSFKLVLANAGHVKNVPGRKSDVNDATWLADLLAHGLVRSSFVPDQPILELRDFMRTRKQLVREITQHKQRIQKVLEDANIKLASVISDVFGVTGRAMLEALVCGVTDPEALAGFTHPRIQTERKSIVEALRGRFTAHHRRLVKMHMQLITSLETAVAEIDQQVEVMLEPFRLEAELLQTIPGVSKTSAATILAEVGHDMAAFPTAEHFVSWTGLCPRQDESAGKRRSTRIRKGAPWLKTCLVQSAWSAVRKRSTYLNVLFLRIKARRGAKKAAVAVAASMAKAIFFILRDKVPYRELGPDHYTKKDAERVANRLARRIRDLGFDVQLSKAA